MGFTEAVRTAFSKPFQVSGRATRPEFWWFTLFNALAYLVITIACEVVGIESTQWNQTVHGLFSLLMLPFTIPLQVRRLHDAGHSGWWIFIIFVPLIGFFVMLYFLLQPSKPEGARFEASTRTA